MNEDTIDRLAPARRPKLPAVMHQRWHQMLFMHWQVAPAEVRPLLPPGLAVDTFEDHAYVTIVGFSLTRSRAAMLPPLPPSARFHEIDVRTYVHREGRDPGMWMLSVDASNRPAVLGARLLLGLPCHYTHATMTLHGTGTGVYEGALPADVRDAEVGRVELVGERAERRGAPARCSFEYVPGGAARTAAPGTLEHFLLERYVLYSSVAGKLIQLRNHHAPYAIENVAVPRWEESLLAAAGVHRPETAPIHHYVKGMDADLFPPQFA